MRGGVAPAASQTGSPLLYTSGPSETASLAEFVSDFFRAAEWVLGCPYFLDTLRELFWQPRPAATSPLESMPVLAAALLDDHAYCLALLTAEPAQALSVSERADLLDHHQRMAWMLRTCLA